MEGLFRVLGMKIKTVCKYRPVGFIVAGTSTCDHDLAPDSQGQWGSETSSSTGPLQHGTASQSDIGTLHLLQNLEDN